MTTKNEQNIAAILAYVKKNEGCLRIAMLNDLGITCKQERTTGLIKDKIIKTLRRDNNQGRVYFYGTYVEPLRRKPSKRDQSYMRAWREKKRKEAEAARLRDLPLNSPVRKTPLVLAIPKYDGEIKTRWVSEGVIS